VTERHLTVSYMPGSHGLWPMIRLKGLWLFQSGFRCGDRVKLTIQPDHILIANVSAQVAVNERPRRYVQPGLYDQL
jgi:hypothetical protein